MINVNKKGFTLIELLVVIAIIGLLSTLAVVALSKARKKANDARRLSDVKQIQTALELYHNDHNLYPDPENAINLGEGDNVCLDNGGFVARANCTDDAYMKQVPSDPDSANGAHYVYTSVNDGEEYTITFTLEADNQSFNAGQVTATPGGMSQQ